MHVIRIKKSKIGYTIFIIEKMWDKSLLSNQTNVLYTKNFLFSFHAKWWAKNKIIEILKTENRLEFING